ncbi:hypothetical protein [Halopiger aswanensis]|uniref:Cytochrome C and Quinol oxidase polypeptide I n=1 Tax=Halopiger aswanensis TaxID=148449 RepID=A0A3R7GFS3_9EURY|nr:hypothetical protein [Halopiger aswanensis]RKD89023.1 Cytochrome C and Quinol oxidase polypeptide I [Halopiger aswanensis]
MVDTNPREQHPIDADSEAAHRPAAGPPLTMTPFHAAGIAFLFVGFALALYQGLQQFELVPQVSWVTWTHIHFVTIGAFTQLLFGTLPQLTARKLERPGPSRLTLWAVFLGLNGALLLAWYGRAFGEPLWFDVGLGTIWLLTGWLFATVLAMTFRTLRGDTARVRDPTVGFYLLSPAIYLIGLTFAFGLYSRGWDVPGGWYGLREAHVHANAWGFLGLAAIGTLYDLFPRLVDAELYSERLKRYSFPLFALGIVPLIVGPVLGMGKTVTAVGLVLYAAGYVLYVYTLARTYRAGTPNGTALSVFVAQLWILGPASFAPFILFGVPLGIPEPLIETGALHFFFLGWALPVALAGSLLAARALEWPAGTTRAGTGDDRGHVDGLVPAEDRPSAVGPGSVLAWNLAVLAVGIGFFYQDQSWSAFLHGTGYAVVLSIWSFYLVKIVTQRRSVRALGQSERSSAD